MEENNKDVEFKNLIHIIRGQQVMLDYDLARLYGYEVRALNQQVKRHIDKFPNDFMFQLTDIEMVELSKSQFVIAIQLKGTKGGRNSNFYAFTEIGIYMLATVLKGEVATKQPSQISIRSWITLSMKIRSKKSYFLMGKYSMQSMLISLFINKQKEVSTSLMITSPLILYIF